MKISVFKPTGQRIYSTETENRVGVSVEEGSLFLSAKEYDNDSGKYVQRIVAVFAPGHWSHITREDNTPQDSQLFGGKPDIKNVEDVVRRVIGDNATMIGGV